MKKFISILTALTFAAALTVGSSAALLGDVNKDGKVNSMDALSILRYIVGLDVGGNFDRAAADINGDGAINSADALSALRITVGLEKHMSCRPKNRRYCLFITVHLIKHMQKQRK